MSAFSKITDIPLITRKAELPKERVLQLLEIEPRKRDKLILIAFRANDLKEVDFEKIESMQGFKFVTLGLSKTYKNCMNIPANFIRFPNLLNACDAAISKPGYGLVAEIIANQTRLLYTSRTDFVEYEVLVNGLKEYAIAKELSRVDFFAGSWQRPLETLLQQTSDWQRIELNGAEIAADEVLAMIVG